MSKNLALLLIKGDNCVTNSFSSVTEAYTVISSSCACPSCILVLKTKIDAERIAIKTSCLYQVAVVIIVLVFNACAERRQTCNVVAEKPQFDHTCNFTEIQLVPRGDILIACIRVATLLINLIYCRCHLAFLRLLI